MTRARPPRTGPEGFTLLELIVVLLVIAIVAGVAVPSFVTAMPGYRLRNDMRGLFAAARYARSRAVITGLRHRLVIDDFEGAYWMEREADPFEAPGSWTPLEGTPGRPQALRGTVRFADIDTQELSDPEGPSRGVVFRPDGTAEREALVVLGLSGDPDELLGLWVRSLTGLSRVVEGEALDEARETLGEVER